MKLLTITVPCHNAQDEIKTCLDSLLPGNEDVEILIVDDGSTDATGSIADEYAEKYPDTVRVIHQENGGHGEAINSGILAATGLYFKVVDSDDWVEQEAYLEILKTLRSLCNAGCMLDMLLTNFVYEKEGAKHKKVMRYTRQLPTDCLFDWSETRKFGTGKYLLMHAVLYRTQILRDCHLVLPKHSFYVDNLFVYVPLPYVEIMYYMDVDFYHYRIGRENQSSTEQSMIRHIDQQIRINKIMIDTYDLKKVLNLPLRRYMLSYLEFVTMLSTALLIRSGTKENHEKRRELWAYIKATDSHFYHHLRRRISGQNVHLPGRRGRGLTFSGYRISQKVMRSD